MIRYKGSDDLKFLKCIYFGIGKRLSWTFGTGFWPKVRCSTHVFFKLKIFRHLPRVYTPIDTGRRKNKPNCHSRCRRSYVAAYDFLRTDCYGRSVEKLFVAATVLVRAAASLRVVFPRRPFASGPAAFAGCRLPKIFLCTQINDQLHVRVPSSRKKPRSIRNRVL